MTRTKILATLGPASMNLVPDLIKAGLDGIRINMSHVRNEDFESKGEEIRRIKDANSNLFLVGDLQGPKIRLGDFQTREVKTGDKVIIIPESKCDTSKIPIQYAKLYKYVSPGNLLLIDDGNVGLRIKDIKNKEITCLVEYGELLEARKGVNIPSISIPMAYLSEKDKRDLEFLIKNGFHYVSASYSRTAEDIKQVRKFAGDTIKIIGKPENHEGNKNLIEIIEASDAMMVPRGDYGMEIGVENVPTFQKRLIELCNIAGKPVITATQMLESMMTTKEPKRAEVSDVFNAVLDGTDVVMLSGETSKGKYPIETVNMMNKILNRAEEYLFDRTNGINLGEKINGLVTSENVSNIISKAVYTASKTKDIKAIIVPTHRGSTVKQIARFRPEQPIIAICYDKEVRRALNAVWGVIPLLTYNKDAEHVIEDSLRQAKIAGYLKKGDNVVITAGAGSYETGATNLMRIEKIQ